MKTIKINLISLFILTGLVGISINANSQDTKLDRKERKEARKAEMSANFYALDTLLMERRFILEADFLQNKIGDMIPVSNTLNFVRVNGSDGILQTGSDSRIGYNGFGGVTAEGNVQSLKINKDYKSFSHRVSFNLLSSLGAFNIDMVVTADNNASATITGTTSGSLTWRGHLKSLENSRAYKGAVLR